MGSSLQKKPKKIVIKLVLEIQTHTEEQKAHHNKNYKKTQYFSFYISGSQALTIVAITLVQYFEFPLINNVSDSIHINGYITNAPPMTFHINCSLMELVLFEKLPNIKLSRSVFRVTIFFQFDSTKSSLNILLQYAQDLEENIQTLYTKLVTDNNDQKTYDALQWNLSYASLLTSCSNEIYNCKCQIIDLHTHLHDIFNILNQSKHSHTKHGIIHSLFNFLFGTTSNAEEINTIKNNIEILKGNHDILSNL